MEKELAKLEAQKAAIIKAMNDTNLCANTASVFSRISGYYRATNLWNTGKAEEFKERKTYSL